jgi:hypothetical protein
MGVTLIRCAFLAFVSAIALGSPAWAQRQSVPVTTIPTVTPQEYDVTDKNGNFVPLATGAGNGGWPLLVTSPAVGMTPTPDGSFDNSAKVSALMNAINPSASGSATSGGPDVVFPAVLGQPYTLYHFTKNFELTRAAHYRCSSTTMAGNSPAVQLVFDAGIDGVIQANGNASSDGGNGAGNFEGCGITSLGIGGGITGAGGTQITSVFQFGAPGGTMFAQPWAVGDGILATPSRAGFHIFTTEPIIAHGAYVSAVPPPFTVGTLTLAAGYKITDDFNPSQQQFINNAGSLNFTAGDTITIGPNTWTFVTGNPATGQIRVGATFTVSIQSLTSSIKTNAADPSTVSPQWGAPTTTPTNLRANAGTDPVFSRPALSVVASVGGTLGDAIPVSYSHTGGISTAAGAWDATLFIPGPRATNNFIDGQTMTIGNSTLRFKNAMSAAGDVKIVANDVYTTIQNIHAVGVFSCDGSTNCITPSPAPDWRSGVFPMTQLGSDSWQMRFYSIVGGGPLAYAGAAASFGTSPPTAFNAVGNHFNSGGTLDNVTLWKLPAIQAYTGVTATSGSPTITINAPPAGGRPLREGDWIWSKAFVYGASVLSVGGQTFPQTVTIGNAFLSGSMNAVASDSGGQLWIIPAALKREVEANTAYNTFSGFPNGLQESCVGFVCGGNDYGNLYTGDMLGRITQGHNTAGTNSFGEIDHVSTLAAVMEGGTLGSNYYGFNANTNDNAAWSFIGNCINQNSTLFLGGYAPAPNPYCADPVNGIFPTSNSGNLPIFMGQSNGGGPPGTPGIQVGQGSQMKVNGGFTFSNGTSFCLSGSGLTFSSDNACGSPYSWDLTWTAAYHAFTLGHSRGSGIYPMIFAGGADPTGVTYPGYAGWGAGITIHPYGLIVAGVEDGNYFTDAKLICMLPSIPTATWHKRGDICFNTSAAHGAPMGWVDLSDGANFIPLGNVP